MRVEQTSLPDEKEDPVLIREFSEQLAAFNERILGLRVGKCP